MQLFAAIDVGSSEISMKIYEWAKRQPAKELEYVRAIVELGADAYTSGMIGTDVVDELCHVLKGFAQKLKEYHVEDYVAYASSDLREASNSDLIIDQIRLRTGLSVEIIDNARERFLILKSLSMMMQPFETLIKEGAAVVDLASGSLQVSVYTKGELRLSQNLRLGSLRIREMLADFKKQTTSYIQIMEDYIGGMLSVFKHQGLEGFALKHMIVTGDEISNVLGAVNASKNRECFTASQFGKFYGKLMRMADEDISRKYDIAYETATVLKPSVIIFKKLAEMLKTETVWTSHVGLCDGIVVDVQEAGGDRKNHHDFTKDMLSAAWWLAGHFNCHVEHAGNILTLSDTMFEGLKKAAGLTLRDKLLLKIAAILHECGQYVNIKGEAEHSWYLVSGMEMPGISLEEQQIIANVIRYSPAANVPDYIEIRAAMNHKNYVRMIKLAAVLRLATVMDKSRSQKIQQIQTSVKDREFRITAHTLYDITLEQGLLEEGAQFFEEVYGLRPSLRVKRGNG